MKLLNLGCGGHRPQDECWWNLDNLHSQLAEGTPERVNLDKELRYVDCDITMDQPPFDPNSFDGILCQHVVEHFCCHDAVAVLGLCRDLLKPDGLLLVSVPDADYFLSVYEQDTPENAVMLFGEPIHDKWQPNFFSYALFRNDHEQILNANSLKCLLLGAGFRIDNILNMGLALATGKPWITAVMDDNSAFAEMRKHLNRTRFSAILTACK